MKLNASSDVFCHKLFFDGGITFRVRADFVNHPRDFGCQINHPAVMAFHHRNVFKDDSLCAAAKQFVAPDFSDGRIPTVNANVG